MPADAPRLHVERHGAGPLLVLAHGFAGSARNFRGQARALADRARVVLYDARGHARSEAPASPAAYAPDALVEDLARVIASSREAPGTTRPEHERVIAGGLSMGAGIALRWALAHPEQVRGLVLAAFPPGAEERRSAQAPTQGEWARAFAAAIERDGLEAAGEIYAWGAASGFDPAAARLVKQGFLEHAPHALRAILLQVLATQPSAAALAPRLRGLDVPALVITGARDALSLGPSRVLARALPRARLVEVADAGHVVNLAAPRAFDAALRAWLDEIAPR